MKKYWLNTLLAILAFLLATGLVAYDTFFAEKPIGEYPQAITLPMHEYTLDWKLGDKIIPYPVCEIGKYNCTDSTLYSYLYIEANPHDYKTKIIMGKDPSTRILHVWLLASDNGTRYVYDWELPIHQDTDYFKQFIGREITYKQLLGYAGKKKK